MITNYANMETDKFKWIKPDGSLTVMKPKAEEKIIPLDDLFTQK